MKMVWWLVLAALGAAGCVRVGAKIEVNENDGYVEISGGKIDVNQAIRQLMADHGWSSAQEGARTTSMSSVRRGLAVSTREGVKLPQEHHQESAQSWIHAKAADGKLVQFDIESATGQPIRVRVSVEEGGRLSGPEVTAELAQRLQQQAHPRRAREPLTIRIDLPAANATEPNAWTGNWTARGDWTCPSGHVTWDICDDQGAGRRHSLYVDGPAPWKVSGGESAESSVSFQLERPAGVMTFEGERSYSSGSGTVAFEPNAVYLRELAGLVNGHLDADQVLTLFFHPVDLAYTRQIKDVLDDELTLAGLITLSNHRVPADYIQGSRAAGYAFSVEQIVRLSSHHIPLEMLQGFKNTGYSLSTDELLRVRDHHLKVEDFTGFRDAGYDFSIDEMIKARNHHVPVEMARTLHDAGFNYDLDQLIKLKNYRVSPEFIVAFQQGGYDLSVEELIKAKNYRVQAKDAARLKSLGYSFSLDDLINLQSYHVPIEFMAQVHDPEYENFTAQELIDFHVRRVRAEAINKIRAAKKKTRL